MKRLSYTIIIATFVFLLMMWIGCGRTHSFPQKIIIPKSGFILESDTKSINATHRMLFYIEYSGCLSCKISNFQKIEYEYQTIYNNKKWEFIYIIETDSLHKYTAYSMFCNARLKGHIYVDTSKSFLSANPDFANYCKNYVFILDSLNNVKNVVGLSQMKKIRL